MSNGTFWNNDHILTPLADKLEDRIPATGKIEGKANAKLERFRKLTNAYYRLYNDGDKHQFFRGLNAAQIEEKMAKAVAEAYAEQFYPTVEVVS
jgi:hypothetical protein